MTKKQGYSSVVCFLTVSIVTIILLLNGLIIHADENVSMISVYDIPDYIFQQSDFGNNFPAAGIQTGYSYESIKTLYDNRYYNNGFVFNSTYLDNFDTPYYLVNSNIDSGGDVDITAIPDGSFLVYNGLSYDEANRRVWYFVFVPVSSGYTSLNSILYSYRSSSQSVYSSSRVNNQYNSQISTIDGIDYYRFRWSDRYLIHMTNLPIYYYDGDILDCESLDGMNDLNTEYGIGGGSSDGETSENNMFLQFPKWYFYNIPKFTSLSSYYLHKNSLGSATFNCKLTDYQKEHLNEFSVKIDIQTYVDFDQEMNDGTVEHNKKLFDYPSQTISLTDFYSNSNNYNVLISDIFERSVSTDALNNSFYLGSWLESYDNIYQDTLNKLQGKFTATLISNNNNNSVSSGACTYTYDYMTGQNMMNDNTLGTNPNPDLEGDQSYNGFDDDNNQVVSNGGNTLINNDNDTINFNGNGEVAERLVDELIPSSGDGGLSQELQDSFNTNGWLAVIKNTFSFIPESLFNTLEVYFVSILGILACAFVLRIILDLL